MTEQQLIDAAENGDVSAMKTLAKFYAQQSGGGNDDKVGDVVSFDSIFKGPKRDPELEAKAYKYYRMAAEAGDAESMTETASRIYDGIGTERNRQNGEYEMWYRRGAEAGDPVAMRVVAFSSSDPVEKFKWYELSAKLDKPGLNKQNSIKETAINYAAGRGTDVNLERAEYWLAQLDEKDAARAMIEISHLTKDISWLKRAAEFLPDANIQIAEEFTLQNDFADALIYYKKAAAQGSPDAMSIIGDIYYIGENGVEQSYEEAFKWYSKAAKLGYNMAAVKCALMIYRGLGVERDVDEALSLFSRIEGRREKFPMVYRFNSVARYYVAKIMEETSGLDEATVNQYKCAAGIRGFVPPNESVRRVSEAAYKVADAYFLRGEDFGLASRFFEHVVEKSEGNFPYRIEAAKKLMWMYDIGEGVCRDEIEADRWRKKANDLVEKSKMFIKQD